MSGQIRMSPATMRERAGEFKREGGAFGDSIAKMKSLIGSLQSEWEGQAAQKFAEQFDQLEPSFNKMKQLIEDIGSQLNATADAVEEMDREISKKFGV